MKLGTGRGYCISGMLLQKSKTYTHSSTFENFITNSMMRFASIKQIEIIGEAANYITEATKNKFSEIEWRQIAGLRQYFST